MFDDYGMPDQLGSNYGNSDAPVVKMPGRGSGAQSHFHTQRPMHGARGHSSVQNPYAQYSGPKAPPQVPQSGGYPTEMIHGYEQQMIRGLPNNAPFAINEVSMTPYDKGMFAPTWTYPQAANIKGVQGYAGAYGAEGDPGMWDQFKQGWDDLWTQGVPQAPITAQASVEQLTQLGNTLAYVGLMTASANWLDINKALLSLQKATKIQESGVYDAATQDALSKAVTAKRQGQAVGDVWTMANEQGILPSWWTTTPAAAPVVPPPEEKPDNTWKWVAGGVAAVVILGGLMWWAGKE
jgi:hypothetical protein